MKQSFQKKGVLVLSVILNSSLQAYAVDPRIQWVREWPGQIVICVNQIYWTAEVHEAIRSGPQGVREYHEKLQSQVCKSIVLH